MTSGKVGEISLSRYERAAAAGQLFVVHAEDRVVAGLQLLWSDEEIWADRTPAVYVHSLVIDRLYAGQGLGAALLDWAAKQGVRDGVGLLRLDCVAANDALCTYYLRLGFVPAGDIDFGPDSGHLPARRFEKRVGPTHD